MRATSKRPIVSSLGGKHSVCMTRVWMTLPRFQFDEDEGDATAPAEFLLKLPDSFVHRLGPAGMFTAPAEKPTSLAERAWLLALVVGALVGVLLIASVSAAATRDHGPVGIAHRAPKTLDRHVRVA